MTFMKNNLKTGDRVTRRNGSVRVCLLRGDDDSVIVAHDSVAHILLSDYQDNLKCGDNFPNFDVMKVERPECLNRALTQSGPYETVYERTKQPAFIVSDDGKSVSIGGVEISGQVVKKMRKAMKRAVKQNSRPKVGDAVVCNDENHTNARGILRIDNGGEVPFNVIVHGKLLWFFEREVVKA